MSDGHDEPEPAVRDRAVPVAWDFDEPTDRAHRSPWKARVFVAAIVVVVLVAVPVAVVLSRHPHRRVAIRVAKQSPERTVLAALDATTNAGNYDMAYVVRTTPATVPTTTADNCTTVTSGHNVTVSCAGGGGPSQAVDLTGRGTVSLDPYAELTVSNVSSFGEITLRTDGTSVWEYGGADYGTSPGTQGVGSQSLSGFAGIVVSTLGPGPGALSMIGLANPTGYLQLEKEAVTHAEAAGTGTVDGTAVAYFRVSIDIARILDAPGLSSEQRKTITSALQLLDQAGYRATDEKIGIDGAGFIRAATVLSRFADGSSMTRTTTLSNFGCAGTVVMPGRSAPTTTAAAHCTGPDTTTTSTTAPSTTTADTSTTSAPLVATTAAPTTSTAGTTSSTAPTSSTAATGTRAATSTTG
jgi:hypothetical protein